MSVQWTDDLAVGIETIDSQHRELFSRIAALVDSIRQSRCRHTIGGTIRFLEEYAVEHFGAEERYMREQRHPGYEQHRAQHHVFLATLGELKRMSDAPRVEGSNYELSVTTNQVVVDWIRNHIMRLDKQLGSRRPD